MDEELHVGIDLGTTYSSVAFIDEEGNPVIETNMEGEGETPSVVFFDPAGGTVVGSEAKARLISYPEDTISGVKRKIGSSFKYTIGGKVYTPVEVSAIILEKLIGDFRKTKGMPVNKAVVTVPAYFGDKEREQTRDAALKAGIRDVELINEPTAAAIAYGYGNRAGGHKRIMVYDLGGGTFDVTILDLEGDCFTAVATDGLRALGGNDWDERLRRLLMDKIAEASATPISILEDDIYLQSEMTIKAEKIKIRLSSEELAHDTITLDNGMKIGFEVSRQEFEEHTSDLLEESFEKVEEVLRHARCSTYDLDAILLVGGSSRMPMVAAGMRKRFPDVRLDIFDPLYAVAKGAAVYAGRDKTGVKMRNVLSKTFGIKVSDGTGGYRISNVIFRNHTLPYSASALFNPEEDGQMSIVVEIYESSAVDGEKHTDIEDATYVDRFDMMLPEASSLDTRIVVEFTANTEGILTAVAKCGKKQGHQTVTAEVEQKEGEE